MLLKILALGAAGYAGYRYWERKHRPGHAAFASGQPKGNHTDVRDAGPQAMRDKPQEEWTKTDQESDESFPASDPPGNY